MRRHSALFALNLANPTYRKVAAQPHTLTEHYTKQRLTTPHTHTHTHSGFVPFVFVFNTHTHTRTRSFLLSHTKRLLSCCILQARCRPSPLRFPNTHAHAHDTHTPAAHTSLPCSMLSTSCTPPGTSTATLRARNRPLMLCRVAGRTPSHQYSCRTAARGEGGGGGRRRRSRRGNTHVGDVLGSSHGSSRGSGGEHRTASPPTRRTTRHTTNLSPGALPAHPPPAPPPPPHTPMGALKHTDDAKPCVRPRSSLGSSGEVVAKAMGSAMGRAECGQNPNK